MKRRGAGPADAGATCRWRPGRGGAATGPASRRLSKRTAARGRPRRAGRHAPRRGQRALQRRPRAGAALAAQLDHLQLRRALGQHGALHPDLHAGVGADGVGHELVAGALHHPARQHDRAGADPAELASRHEVRHPVSGVRARRVRHARLERAGADARARRVRLVRHSGVDWRGSAAHVLQDRRARLGDAARRRDRRAHDDRVGVVPAVLGPEHLHHLSRHGPAARGGELGGAVRARHDRRAAVVGRVERQRPRAAARAAGQVPHARASSCRCSCRR